MLRKVNCINMCCLSDSDLNEHWAIPFNICTPHIELLGNLRGREGVFKSYFCGAFMSVSLNSFFFPEGGCVGTLILISEGVLKSYF